MELDSHLRLQKIHYAGNRSSPVPRHFPIAQQYSPRRPGVQPPLGEYSNESSLLADWGLVEAECLVICRMQFRPAAQQAIRVEIRTHFQEDHPCCRRTRSRQGYRGVMHTALWLVWQWEGDFGADFAMTRVKLSSSQIDLLLDEAA